MWCAPSTIRGAISVDRIIDATLANVGPMTLRQIRELIADLLEL